MGNTNSTDIPSFRRTLETLSSEAKYRFACTKILECNDFEIAKLVETETHIPTLLREFSIEYFDIATEEEKEDVYKMFYELKSFKSSDTLYLDLDCAFEYAYFNPSPFQFRNEHLQQIVDSIREKERIAYVNIPSCTKLNIAAFPNLKKINKVYFLDHGVHKKSAEAVFFTECRSEMLETESVKMQTRLSRAEEDLASVRRAISVLEAKMQDSTIIVHDDA